MEISPSVSTENQDEAALLDSHNQRFAKINPDAHVTKCICENHICKFEGSLDLFCFAAMPKNERIKGVIPMFLIKGAPAGEKNEPLLILCREEYSKKPKNIWENYTSTILAIEAGKYFVETAFFLQFSRSERIFKYILKL